MSEDQTCGVKKANSGIREIDNLVEMASCSTCGYPDLVKGALCDRCATQVQEFVFVLDILYEPQRRKAAK